jgi:putative endopeptidase
MIKSLWLSAAAVALMAGTPVLAQQAPTVADLSKAPRMGPWGFALDGRDPAVTPGQSLYLSADGHYLTALQIPADRSRYGAFDTLNELSQARMRAVSEKAAADHAATGPSALVGTLYRSYLDEARVNALGARPLAPSLARIRAARTRDDIAQLMGRSMKDYGGAFFSLAVFDDAKAPLRYAVYVGQAGLGLPDRDYYLDPRFATQKTAYQAYVARMLALAGWPQPAAAAKSIVELETEIAKVSWTAAERRDDDKTYNPYDVTKLAAYAPGFNWQAFLQGADLSGRGRVVAQENTALPKIAALYAQAPVATLKAWMAFHVTDNAAPYLSADFDQAHFEFRQKTLSGQPQQQPRWRRGVVLLDSQIGEALGQLYVAAYFPPQDKAIMQAMVGDILAAMKVRLQNVDWMAAQTKAKALEKLASFNVKLAYPDHWRDYSGLRLTDDDLYGDVERASAFEWARRVARLDKPVDRTEWEMTPSTINAYYSPTRNEIVFPAAILQPPFFDADGDPAINYGAIGGVIGHEITHGFDDQGRKYGGDGSLRDWWTPADAAKFQVQATRLGKQYSAIEVLPGAHIDGDRTMGENIADLGGMLLALDAYHLSLKGQPAPVIDGLTGDQRVFLGWAQVWRSKSRDDRTRQQLVSDPHSPAQYRVDVPARNIDAFYTAFGVKPGDAMYVAPADRVKIW